MNRRFIISILVLVSFAALAVSAWLFNAYEYVTLDNLKEHRELLQRFVDDHYFSSVAVFVAFYISTAFFVPGAIPATVAGGFLFGILMGTVYVTIGSVTGAALAFLASRFLIGDRIQNKYRNQLKRFNEAIEKHGHNYLFTLRIIPILPFFLTNYLAGMTTMPLKTFILITALGMLPGSLVYTFAGRQLAQIQRLEDILTPEFLIAFLSLALFSLLPVIMDLIKIGKQKH